jgi:hypothetical protein
MVKLHPAGSRVTLEWAITDPPAARQAKGDTMN